MSDKCPWCGAAKRDYRFFECDTANVPQWRGKPGRAPNCYEAELKAKAERIAALEAELSRERSLRDAAERERDADRELLTQCWSAAGLIIGDDSDPWDCGSDLVAEISELRGVANSREEAEAERDALRAEVATVKQERDDYYSKLHDEVVDCIVARTDVTRLESAVAALRERLRPADDAEPLTNAWLDTWTQPDHHAEGIWGVDLTHGALTVFGGGDDDGWSAEIRGNGYKVAYCIGVETRGDVRGLRERLGGKVKGATT